tara:strand:- start:1484 stop:1705 length:222 start_codon:yes stop_codon:yes gene_type:complete
MKNNKQTNISPGDLVTLKGMKKIKEKPIGMVKKVWATEDVEIFWLNENIAKRYAVHDILKFTKLEIVSEVIQQ